MIRINLLPDEYARAEGTPLPRLIAIVASAVVVFTLGLLCAQMYLRKLPDARTELQEAQTTLATRRKQVEDSGYEDLLRTIGALEMRKNAISDIYRSRVEWARKLDQLVDLVPPSIGLVRMQLSEPDRVRGSRTEMHGGVLTLECLTQGDDLAYYSNFVATLQGSPSEKPASQTRPARSGESPGGALSGLISTLVNAPAPEADGATGKAFFDDFTALRDLGWVVQDDRDYLPALRFTLELILKPRASQQ